MTASALPPDRLRAMARAMRKGRFDRNGRGSVFDPDLPVTDNELADAQACWQASPGGELMEASRAILACDREALADHRPKFGIADCVDNEGVPYQSAQLGSALEALRQALPQGGGA